MISERRLARLLSSLAGTTQRGTFFRSIDLQWLLQNTPLSAIGSRLRGGRYNRKGDFEAFYIASTQETALYETGAIFKMAGVVVGVRQPPRVMLSIDYDLHHIVDLREPSVLKGLGLTIENLKQPWKLAQAEARPVLTQRIGAAARAVDIEGLFVPSARLERGTNLVLFPDRLRAGSIIELYVGDELTIPRYTVEGQYVPKARGERTAEPSSRRDRGRTAAYCHLQNTAGSECMKLVREIRRALPDVPEAFRSYRSMGRYAFRCRR